MPTTLEQPAPSFADVWRMFQETDLKFKETDKAIKKVSDNIDKLGNRLGEFVEEMVKPGVVRLFQARGLKVHRTMQNLTCRDDGGQRLAEVDLLVVDTDTALWSNAKASWVSMTSTTTWSAWTNSRPTGQNMPPTNCWVRSRRWCCPIA